MKNVEDLYPLSPLQQGLLFHSVLEPASGVYVNQSCYRLRGDLDAAVFRATWQRLIDRHPILRTAFLWEGLAEPVQAVRQRVRIPWQEEDWRALPASEREARLSELRAAERLRSFDLAKAPLLRCLLVRLTDDEHELIWTFHHILLDGWSTPLLLREVLAIHSALGAGREPDLPPAPRYRDYIAWLKRQDLAATEAFWRNSLAGFTSPTPPGFGRPAGPVGGPAAEEQAPVDSKIAAALQALAARHQMTLNSLVLGGWALLLGRYSGEPDVLFGSVVSGRPVDLPGVESMVGLFINTLPVRVAVPAGQRLHPWLREIQKHQIELRQHEHSPLVQIQKWSDVPAGTRLFESLFVFENYPVGATGAAGGAPAGLRVTDIRSVESTGYPLTLAAWMAGDLGLRLSYDSGRFEQAAARRLLGHLANLLAAIASGEDRPLSHLPLLTAEEERQIASWNETRTGWDLETRLHALIEARADLHPAAPAVTFSGTTLSYGELDQRANRLAHRLIALGAGPEERVALFMERSIELVVALLAVLKSGAAYLPLDPDHPAERIAFQAVDSRPAVLLTQAHLADRLPSLDTPLLFLTPAAEEVAGESAARPAVHLDPSHPAYVLYTSGSTGRPKGVSVPHRAIVNRLLWMQDAYRLTEADRVLQKTPYSFDVSVWEFFWPLLAGARLIVAPPGVHGDSAWLVRGIREEGITVMHFVPSMMRAFLEERGVEACASLRDVMASGEALPGDLSQRFLVRLGARLHNLYGPTEAAVDVTFWECLAGAEGPVPIGRPIANTRIRLLNRDLNPVPVGVAGELYIGGANLARGYFARPALTAERFVPDPDAGRGGEPGARLYRTGDLARYREDGAIEYLDRIDQQVKVRGFRIELGEIEATLLDHPAVLAAAVVAPQRPDGHRRLVAYVVGEALPGGEALRRFLLERLPEYMVPSLFLPLASLPLSGNGKLDRRRLPDPALAQPSAEESAPPEGSVELALAAVWSEVLKVERIGRGDNFFALGGDSILSLRIISSLREQGFELSLQQLFQNPTLRELAAALGGAVAARPSVPPFGLISEQDREAMPPDVEDAYPLALLQAGMVFHTEQNPEAATYHDIFCYHLRAPFDAGALRSAAHRVAERHPVLRTSFALSGYREPLQLVHRDARPELNVESLLHLSPDERTEALSRWMEEEKRYRFEWSRAPLLRFQVHRLTEDELRFAVSFHHSILDGWSVATLLTELFQQYLSQLGREAPVPPAPTLPYREFVADERRALASEETLAYWLRQLGSGPRPRLARWPFTPDSAARQVRLASTPIDREVTEGLKRLADAAGVPIKSVLVAAHLRAVSLWSGETSPTIGLVSNGRSESGEGERVLGLFLNATPFRVDLAPGSWTDLSRQVFREETGMLPHRLYPMADLQRRLGGQPLFETSFTYVNFHVYEQLAGFSEVQVLGSEGHEETSFPLSVFFSYSPSVGHLDMGFDYDAGQFDAAQVERITATHAAALKAMAADPGARWETDPLLPEAEAERLLALADGGAPAAGPEPVHRWFERLAAEAPDALAVVAEQGSLTRGQLERRSNQVARALRLYGVKPETNVALAVRRTPEMAIALLGIWKSGGAWVPLDPAWPSERLVGLIEDSESAVVVTTDAVRNDLPAQIDRLTVLSLDTDGWLIDTQEEGPLADGADAENPAYLIYTSGSSGRPKAVVVPHRGLGNLAAAQIESFRIAPEDRLLQFASLSFDAAVSEVVTALLGGAELHLAEASRMLPGPDFVSLLNERRITHLTIPPSALAVMPAAELPHLKTLVVAGEACPPELARRWMSGRRFVNAYGPTETTVCATVAILEGEVAGTRLPLGSPLPGFRALVLDRQLEPPPAGAPGEIFLAGVGLARGYRGRPDLTAASWVPDPYASAPGGRLYATGDLARRLPDGTLELLGRIDQQVKVRGYRIEIGEIEARLAAHPEVQAAAVAAREDTPGDRRLVAYVVLAEGTAEAGQTPGELSPTFAAALRTHLSQTLPDYMVPSFFAGLPALPLTSSGKVDRRALPAPDQLHPAAERPYAAPRNPAEETLARIWAEVLSLERVGIDDNLFEIGGHSLLATQIVVRVQESFGVEVPVRLLFDVPTVAGLATAILQKQAEQADEESVARMLAELEQLSEEDLQTRLAEEAGS